MNSAAIRQHGKTIYSWGVGPSRRITNRIRKQADQKSKKIIDQGRMETGYYDLVLITGIDREIDSEILIA